MSKLYNVGAYVRLSVESTSYESDSVENQCSMLSKFIAMMPGWVEQKIYVDDGFSGATFQRPAFLEMMEDVRKGSVNLVLVKDLSRFGRNYLEAGHYLEEVLPSLDCRFVSLTENIDTENGENDIIPFLNAMNDYYVKNHSDRIRLIMEAKAKDGQKIAGHAPYGYRRNPHENTRLIIDEYSAGIIRRIFEMRMEGLGVYTIAKTLNTEGVVPPILYYLESADRDNSHVKSKSWRPANVGKMLKNELYIGNAVQNKRKVVSYRDKREVSRPIEEQIRVDGAFPAIIDHKTWDRVQNVNEIAGVKYQKKREPVKKLFSGILFCADCGTAFVSVKKDYVSKQKSATYVNYLCGRFHSSAGAECTRHSVGEKTLSDIVFEQIKQLTSQVKIDERGIVNALSERLIGEQKISHAQHKKDTTQLHKRLHKLETTMSKLYEDRVTGLLSEDVFSSLIKKNETERLETENQLSLSEVSSEESIKKTGDIKNWIRLIKENSAVKILDRSLLESLVDRIEIGESKVVNGVKEQEIRICYKFIGDLK